jgi:hypothetical protein
MAKLLCIWQLNVVTTCSYGANTNGAADIYINETQYGQTALDIAEKNKK